MPVRVVLPGMAVLESDRGFIELAGTLWAPQFAHPEDVADAGFEPGRLDDRDQVRAL